MAEDMASSMLDKANRFYSAGLKNINLLMKTLGTKFVVLRSTNSSKWKNVFGGSYSSNSTLENDYEQFTTRLIINKNEMMDVWNRNRDTIESVTTDGNIEVGDELQYTRNGITYRFKVSQKFGFSETADTLYRYLLTSIVETKDM